MSIYNIIGLILLLIMVLVGLGIVMILFSIFYGWKMTKICSITAVAISVTVMGAVALINA